VTPNTESKHSAEFLPRIVGNRRALPPKYWQYLHQSLRFTSAPEPRVGFAARQLIARRQHRFELTRHCRASIYQSDGRGQHFSQQRLEERVMRAAKNQCIAALFEQRLDKSLKQRSGGRGVQLTRLDAFDQPGTRLGDNPDITCKTIQ